jgi:phosphatidate cytidylyltransferase
MLLQRILTVAVVLPLFLTALFLLPSLYWGVLTAGIVLLAGHEWSRLAGYSDTGAALFCTMLALSCGAILWWEQGAGAVRLFIQTPAGKLSYGAATVFWLAVAPACLLRRWRLRGALLLAAVGWIVLIPFWHALVCLQPTPVRLLVALSVVWVADTAAYFVGRRFGRHKLAPAISPGKTWEGAAGALAAVAIYWIAVWALLPGHSAHLASGLVWVASTTALAIEGDLFESWMKRLAGLKDSGSLLPGHGGVLDRVDSLTATLPLAVLYFAYPFSGIS